VVGGHELAGAATAAPKRERARAAKVVFIVAIGIVVKGLGSERL
jgi:hypothetical protein